MLSPFTVLGYLGKFFSESFESMDIKVARGLKLIGASPSPGIPLWPLAKCESTGMEPFFMDAGI